jgi:hypothetical protein
MRIFLRILANMIYLMFFKKVVKEINQERRKRLGLKGEEKDKPKVKRLNLLLQFIARMIVSLDHLNIISNLLFMGTSLSLGVSLFDFLVILVDLTSLFFVQFMLFRVFKKYQGLETREVKTMRDQHLILSAFYMQNGDGLTLPTSFVINVIQIARMAMIFFLKYYQVTFGVAFLALNLGILALLIMYASKSSNSFQKIYWLFITAGIMEALLFSLLGLLAIV